MLLLHGFWACALSGLLGMVFQTVENLSDDDAPVPVCQECSADNASGIALALGQPDSGDASCDNTKRPKYSLEADKGWLSSLVRRQCRCTRGKRNQQLGRVSCMVPFRAATRLGELVTHRHSFRTLGKPDQDRMALFLN